MVVTLNNGPSIHNAWKNRPKDYSNIIIVKYFTQNKEMVDFINSFLIKYMHECYFARMLLSKRPLLSAINTMGNIMRNIYITFSNLSAMAILVNSILIIKLLKKMKLRYITGVVDLIAYLGLAIIEK